MEKSKTTVKTCYYELLEVESTATQKEIEKVYSLILKYRAGLQTRGA